MANPVSSWLRKLMRHPLLQSSGNRAVLAIALIIVAVVVLSIVGTYREHAEIAACKQKGGTLVYRTDVQEVPTDSRGNIGINQEYQVFDYCDYGKQ
jgi:hypothetical protein